MDIWMKMERDYIAGGMSYRQLSEKYGISLRQVSKQGKLRNWPLLRREGSADDPKMQAMPEDMPSGPAAKDGSGAGAASCHTKAADCQGESPLPLRGIPPLGKGGNGSRNDTDGRGILAPTWGAVERADVGTGPYGGGAERTVGRPVPTGSGCRGDPCGRPERRIATGGNLASLFEGGGRGQRGRREWRFEGEDTPPVSCADSPLSEGAGVAALAMTQGERIATPPVAARNDTVDGNVPKNGVIPKERSDRGDPYSPSPSNGSMEGLLDTMLLRLQGYLREERSVDPQKYKHITAVLKDIRDLRPAKDAKEVTVVLGEAEELSL